MSAVRGALNSLGILLDECNVVLQVSGNEALKTAVKVGAGIGFVSRQAVMKELAEGSLVQVPVTELQIKRDFYALLNEGLEMPVTLALWEYLLTQQDLG
jgi:DNA-binding transcriptional LysR family regulator